MPIRPRSRFCLAASGLAVLCHLLIAWLAPASAQGEACSTLACPKCEQLCRGYCEIENQKCAAKGRRGCPGAYRACTRGCTAELCRQCVPIQHVEKDKTFHAGTTNLCQTPGYTSGKK
ncbi:MAG TPA: hypothetical protein PK264_13550 [Hyphomicrobiaceae bacterium]|nr:hypothetical protein [Hyphomicrobiaceae bacterium]